MKVCTDACLFGAWIAKQLRIQNLKIKNAFRRWLPEQVCFL